LVVYTILTKNLFYISDQMKQIVMLRNTLIIFAITLIAITACKKDVPVTSVNYLTVNGTTYNLTETTDTTHGHYYLTGTNPDDNYNLDIDFGAKPLLLYIGVGPEPASISFTETLGPASTIKPAAIKITDNKSNVWLASSGTATFSTSGNSVTVVFSGVIFSADSGNAAGSPATLTASGSLYSPY